MTDAAEVEIVRLGAEGDGVAQTVRGPVFVPFALPGERWRDNDGVWQRMSDGTERRAAPCRHFGRCGGCVAQHMSAELYARWKRDMLVEAFRHRGLNAEVEALRTVSERSRRRAFLGVERHGPEVVVGFREEGSHTLVDIEECLVLEPAIMAALGAMKEIARLVMPEDEGGRLVVTRLDHGLDVSFDNGRKDLAPETRAAAARIATDARFIRLTIAGEPVVELGAPVVTLGGVEVEPPQGAFLQAVPEAEALLVELVVGALPKRAKRAADLFSGLGTFAFPLGRRVRVTAIDGDRRAIHALERAARKATGLKPIEAIVRDLYREPLAVRELDQFDALVFDPPRAGAALQAERIAKCSVPVVIAVSCNAATLARDARMLIDGGYVMGPVTPVDQFLYAPHVEAVAVFRRT